MNFSTRCVSQRRLTIVCCGGRILDALCSQLGQSRGTVIDIGCGDLPYRSLLLARPSQANKYIGLDLKHDTCEARSGMGWAYPPVPGRVD